MFDGFPECGFQAVGEEGCRCAHPLVRLPGRTLTPEVCRACNYRELPDDQALAPEVVGGQAPSAGNGAWLWSVGMTTAPRRLPTLEPTLDSIRLAGWESVRLFAEPDTGIPERYQTLPRTQHDDVLGAFPNWLLGLAELYLRQPHANAYLMCQDDVVLAQGLREYLEATLWPAEDVGVVSVYCPSHYAGERSSGYYIEDRGWDTWGALAYVFPNPATRALLSDRSVIDHRHQGRAHGLRNVDAVVGHWCQQTGRPYYVHVPSLAEHIGLTSTLYPGSSNRGQRGAGRFESDARVLPVGDAPDTSSENSVGPARAERGLELQPT